MTFAPGPGLNRWMLTAHALGIPAEELLLPIAAGGGTFLLMARAWIGSKRLGARTSAAPAPPEGMNR